MAELQWEAACERLRNALQAPPNFPTDAIPDRAEALEVAQKGLDALRRAYENDNFGAKSNRADAAMKEKFQRVRALLEVLAAQTLAEPATPVGTHDRGTSSATPQDIDVLVALYDYGFVRATESSTSGQRELTSPALTADGRDLLDALRNATMWARVEHMAATQGVTLSLGTAMAAVAAALTGGFNS